MTVRFSQSHYTRFFVFCKFADATKFMIRICAKQIKV